MPEAADFASAGCFGAAAEARPGGTGRLSACNRLICAVSLNPEPSVTPNIAAGGAALPPAGQSPSMLKPKLAWISDFFFSVLAFLAVSFTDAITSCILALSAWASSMLRTPLSPASL